jgi:hypothetical protein
MVDGISGLNLSSSTEGLSKEVSETVVLLGIMASMLTGYLGLALFFIGVIR